MPVTYELWLYEAVGEETAAIETQVEEDLTEMFAARPIGGDIIAPATTGKLYQSLIAATIEATHAEHVFKANVTAPAGDTALAINEVPVLGAVTATVHKEAAA